MKKTKLLTTLGAVALIGAIGVGSTLAYLTDTTETVTNTFTVGNVNFDDEFGSGLRESEVVRKDGKYVDNDDEGIWKSLGNEYTDLAAGEEVCKDPTVIMGTDSQDAWVFAKIENANSPVFDKIAWSGDWTDVTEAYKSAKEITGDVDYVVYAKKDTIAKEESSTIFTSVTMADDITSETQIPTITVKAFAIQAAGFSNYTDALSQVVFE